MFISPNVVLTVSLSIFPTVVSTVATHVVSGQYCGFPGVCTTPDWPDTAMVQGESEIMAIIDKVYTQDTLFNS